MTIYFLDHDGHSPGVSVGRPKNMTREELGIMADQQTIRCSNAVWGLLQLIHNAPDEEITFLQNTLVEYRKLNPPGDTPAGEANVTEMKAVQDDMVNTALGPIAAKLKTGDAANVQDEMVATALGGTQERRAG